MLTPVEQKQLDRYQKMIAMPRWKFIVVYGMLSWGLSVAVVVSLITWYNARSHPHKDLQAEILIYMIGFPIGGIFYGMFMRKFIPRQIKRLEEKAKN